MYNINHCCLQLSARAVKTYVHEVFKVCVGVCTLQIVTEISKSKFNIVLLRHSEKLSPAIINHKVVILYGEVESWTNVSIHRGIKSTVITEQQSYAGISHLLIALFRIFTHVAGSFIACILLQLQKRSWYSELFYYYNDGMARFQDGGSNQCIIIYTTISSPGNKIFTSKRT